MRVLVTGTGCICSLGGGVPAVLERLRAGSPPPESSCRLEANLPQRPLARRVPPECAAALEGPVDRTRTNRLALAAAREALRSAGIAVPAEQEVGICIGTTTGMTFNDEPFYRRYLSGEDIAVDAVARYLDNEPASVLARELGLRGPRLNVTTACAAGTDAIGIAAGWIAQGRCRIALAGGADELSRFTYLGFASLKNCSQAPCRPFDRRRRGLNLGEGAAFLVLEAEESAAVRGRVAVGEVSGYSTFSDAYHMTAPHPDGRGLRQALLRALAQARISPADVSFVNAHGTGTTENDRVEGRVLAASFPPGTPVAGTKGFTGHTLGAAGAIEAVLTVHGLRDLFVPRTAGFEEPDPECEITPTTTPVHLPQDARFAVSTSLAFGGGNSVLVFHRVEERR